MTATTNRQILLIEKPKEKLGPEHFRMAEAAMPEPKDGEALVKVRYISLDAANRAWMQGATYRAAVETDSVMPGGGIAEVVASKAPGLVPGDIVFADTGWQDYAVLPGKHLTKLPKVEPLTHLLSVYGIAGLTAYFGLLEIGQPKAGETVVVSAAAGSVGSIVGQIAKIKGCRVVGIAGGKAKCDWLVDELGFDAAVDYKDGALFKALRAAAPNGIDVYFDNVGGDILEACLAQMNLKRPHRLLRRGLAIRPHAVGDRPARRARADRGEAADHAGLHRDGLHGSPRRGGRRTARLGRERQAEGAGRRHRRPGKHAGAR